MSNGNEIYEIKESIKQKKEKLHMSNQDLAEQANMSLHTINNYLSARSKSASAITVGYICRALHLSFDRAFGIESDEETENTKELRDKIEQLEKKCIKLEEEAIHKDKMLEATSATICNLKSNIKMARIFASVLLIICVLLIALGAAYLIYFDLSNPNYGIFRD